MSDNKNMYLDYAATTPVLPEVIDVITDTMKYVYGNPSSMHSIGREAEQVLDDSRKIIANSINCKPNEIIFTSGACEANSLAIDGYLRDSINRKLITTKIEHKSIELIAKNYSYLTEYVNVDRFGCVELNHLEKILKKTKKQVMHYIVSIQFANSEIGTIQNIKKISDIVHKYNGILHTDATQIFPYKKIDVQELGIDMLSMSGQKIGAPKGIGFLYVKDWIYLHPSIYGTQMGGKRGGTENIPYIAGLSKAIELLDYKNNSMENMQYYIFSKLSDMNFDYKANGSMLYRLPNNINVSFRNLSGEAIMLLLNEHYIFVSTGSACSNGSNMLSSTLEAIQVPDDYINGTIRITLPKDNFTKKDADYLLNTLYNITNELYFLQNEQVGENN